MNPWPTEQDWLDWIIDSLDSNVSWNSWSAVDTVAYVDNHMHERLPTRFRRASLDELPDDAAAYYIKDWLNARFVRKEPGNLLLLGPVGVGKTHAAAAILRHCSYIQRSPGVFWSVPQMLRALRPGGDDDPDEVLWGLTTAPHLVLDDLGAHRPTEWAVETLEEILDCRWVDELSTIVTSNLSPAGLEESLGPRAYSRLVHDACAVQITGEDRRRKPAPPQLAEVRTA